MRRLLFIAAFFGLLCVAAGWAETVQPAVSSGTLLSTTTAAVPLIEISTPTMADAGETISTPTLHAMTDPANALSFVTLTRTRLPSRLMPANADIVDPEVTRTFDALNAGEALFHEEGVSFRPQGAPSYPLNASIRGAPFSQTLVLLDGRPMKGVALGAADLSEIPLEQIDHLEIVRGGVSALYGPNAMGGVINIISKRAVYAGFPISHVSYEGASFGRQNYKLDYGSRLGPLDYFFFGNQQWQSGFRSNSDNSQYNIGGNAGLSMGRAGKLLLDVASYHNNAGIPGFRCDDTVDATCVNSTTPLDPDRFNNKDEKPASTPYARQITDSTYFRTSYLVSLSTEVSVAARLFTQQRELDLDDAADPNPAHAMSTDRREHSKGGELQVALPLGLLVGGTFAHDQEDLADRLSPANSFSVWEENWAFFAQETLHWKSLTVIPSGRYDKNSQFGDTANPRVQTFVDAAEWLRFSASADRSFRAPTFDEVMPIPSRHYLGNIQLRPETAWTYEAGFTLHESSRSFHANYFRANVEDSIQTFVPQDPSDPLSPLTAVNVGRARRQGAEVQIDHVANAYFREAWNYTYLENVGITAGVSRWVPLAYSPRHTVNFLSTITPTKRWSMDVVARYEDARYSGNDQTGTKMGSQLVGDIRLAYQWRQMEIYCGVKDVADKRYVEVPGYPLAGRTAFWGLRLRLWG